MSNSMGVGIFWIALNRADLGCWRLTLSIDKWMSYHHSIMDLFPIKVFQSPEGDTSTDKILRENDGSTSHPSAAYALKMQISEEDVYEKTVGHMNHPENDIASNTFSPMSPAKSTSFQETKALVSNLGATSVSQQNIIQKINELAEQSKSFVSLDALNNRFERLTNSHKQYLNIRNNRVSDLELETYNLKESQTRLQSTNKSLNKSVGKLKMN